MAFNASGTYLGYANQELVTWKKLMADMIPSIMDSAEGCRLNTTSHDGTNLAAHEGIQHYGRRETDGRHRIGLLQPRAGIKMTFMVGLTQLPAGEVAELHETVFVSESDFIPYRRYGCMR